MAALQNSPARFWTKHTSGGFTQLVCGARCILPSTHGPLPAHFGYRKHYGAHSGQHPEYILENSISSGFIFDEGQTHRWGMGSGTWNARVDLEALSFVMQAHDRADDEPLDYDVERKCHVHPVTGNVVTEKIYKSLAEMREGLLRNAMEATCHTAMLLDVTVEEGADMSTIKGLIDELEENPWVVRNS